MNTPRWAIATALEPERDGCFALAGPECLSMDDLERRLNGKKPIPIRHIPSPLARMLPWVVPDLPGALVDVMLRGSVSPSQTTTDFLGLQLISRRQVWAGPKR